MAGFRAQLSAFAWNHPDAPTIRALGGAEGVEVCFMVLNDSGAAAVARLAERCGTRCRGAELPAAGFRVELPASATASTPHPQPPRAQRPPAHGTVAVKMSLGHGAAAALARLQIATRRRGAGVRCSGEQRPTAAGFPLQIIGHSGTSESTSRVCKPPHDTRPRILLPQLPLCVMRTYNIRGVSVSVGARCFRSLSHAPTRRSPRPLSWSGR